MIEKIYSAHTIEAKQFKMWTEGEHFSANLHPDGKPYTIMMPPPNVTGYLHIGHALTYTLQDILIRHHRKQGRKVLWQSGMDHAGISTQIVVERRLDQEGISRHTLGRDEFVKRVWEWKEYSGGKIKEQMDRLGLSVDWSRGRFTMDEGFSHAVRDVFVKLFEEGLIYRDKRLVHWDATLQSTLSDLEVINKPIKGYFYYLRYPLQGQEIHSITVATTRPETLFGDTAIAVHPDDERFKHLIGQKALNPLTNQPLPIIADSYCDPQKGTGAVKITPGHDFNDFEVGKRHDLPIVNIFTDTNHLNENAPPLYQRLSREEAREKVIEALNAKGLIEKIEELEHTVPYGERSQSIVEPRLTNQWFVDAKKLAIDAIKAVEESKTVFVPPHWAQVYFQWMRNIQPWCISRQLWWGHRIPAWYGPDKKVFVAISQEQAKIEAKLHYGKEVALEQDEDVLDTWFSSSLWPFATLAWPEKHFHYPGDVLITGHDIIFFWVARMMMMGLYFNKEVPFKTVYIHALVKDEKGQKMSKSKGNVADPLDLIERYGADALRLTLTLQAAPGRDIRFSDTKIEGSRNFNTKLWNATRFCLMNGCELKKGFRPSHASHLINQWIIHKTEELRRELEEAYAHYRFNDISDKLYQFTWKTFCDWYLEFTKPIIAGENQEAKTETQQTTAWVLRQILQYLHPLIPFITEELWPHIHLDKQEPLVRCSYDTPEDVSLFAASTEVIDRVCDIISGIRRTRMDMGLSVKIPLPIIIVSDRTNTSSSLYSHEPLIKKLAHVSEIRYVDQFIEEKGVYYLPLKGVTLAIPFSGMPNMDQQGEKLQEELKKIKEELQKHEKKLANSQFMANAPEEVVLDIKERQAQAMTQKEKMEQILKYFE